VHGLADTIFAVASGPGMSAVTMMRISGPQSSAIVTALCGRLPVPRRASVCRLTSDGRLIDRAMVLWLPGPGSYTGEDSAELHLHGGRAVLAAAADALAALGARPAEAGEFTRRAFLNGRMDLTEAEGVADLIAAETEAQRVQALRQMDGELGTIYRKWSERLLRLLAQMEALIDFPDEDLPPEVEARIQEELAQLITEMRHHLEDGRRGELLREGLVFAIVGPPNAGKSTLINAIARRDVAIVAASPGTTRDVLEVRISLAGVPVTLLDTAGLRETSDDVEAEGVRRALKRAAVADLVIAVNEAENASSVDHGNHVIEVQTKADLKQPVRREALPVSALSGQGMDVLLAKLGEMATALTRASGPPALTRTRHRVALMEAAQSLEQAITADLPELRAEDMRLALRAIGRITGSVGVEDVLDSVFSQFCIGK
jgi:tRNA modification GTPase